MNSGQSFRSSTFGQPPSPITRISKTGGSGPESTPAHLSRRIWQSEGRWLPDRIHQIHLPDAIASDAERKIGCPETEVGKDECSWEMHSDTQNNKGLFLFNSLAYTFEYSRGGSYIPQIPCSVPGGAGMDISDYPIPTAVINGIRSVKISHGPNSDWVRVGLHSLPGSNHSKPNARRGHTGKSIVYSVVLKRLFLPDHFSPDILGSSPALIWNSNQGKSPLKILVPAGIFTMK